MSTKFCCISGASASVTAVHLRRVQLIFLTYKIISRMKISFLCLALLCLSLSAMSGQNTHTAKGYVFDQRSGDPLAGAHVLVKDGLVGVTANDSGYFHIVLMPGEDSLSIRFPNYQTQHVPAKKAPLRIGLAPIEELDTVLSMAPITYEETYQIVRLNRNKLGDQPAYQAPPPPSEQAFSGQPNTEDYSPIAENREHQVWESPVSTFSIDVDGAAYSNVRRFLRQGQQPPKDAVRVEELINYFDYGYPAPKAKDAPLALYTELSDCPWNSERRLLHIGLQGRKIDRAELPPSNLTFLMDVSGSMNEANKLPLAKQALRLLVGQMREEDRIAIVVYSGAAGLVLPSTPGHEKERILTAIDGMNAGGSTAGAAGIRLAYQVARESFLTEGINRVILVTDGDFNVGVSSDGELVEIIEQERASGVFLSVLGFGQGNYKDNKMEQLANKGNGNYAYIDQLEEAKKVFVEELPGTLFTIAKDVKLQLEFNPAAVQSYRLVGYENRLLDREDFADDAKDAGELGAGHTVTALYELTLPPAAPSSTAGLLRYQEQGLTKQALRSKELAFLQIRYKAPDSDESQLMTFPIKHAPVPLPNASEAFRFSAAVAAFGLQLRGSNANQALGFPQIRRLAEGALGSDEAGHRKGFLEMVDWAAGL